MHILLNTFVFQAELGFRCGDIIYVLGDMDQDGFFFVSVIYCKYK